MSLDRAPESWWWGNSEPCPRWEKETISEPAINHWWTLRLPIPCLLFMHIQTSCNSSITAMNVWYSWYQLVGSWWAECYINKIRIWQIWIWIILLHQSKHYLLGLGGENTYRIDFCDTQHPGWNKGEDRSRLMAFLVINEDAEPWHQRERVIQSWKPLVVQDSVFITETTQASYSSQLELILTQLMSKYARYQYCSIAYGSASPFLTTN